MIFLPHTGKGQEVELYTFSNLSFDFSFSKVSQSFTVFFERRVFRPFSCKPDTTRQYGAGC